MNELAECVDRPTLEIIVATQSGVPNRLLEQRLLAADLETNRSIGAHGLLARVGCYYHDVGKVKKPQFFVENQSPGAPCSAKQ